MNLEELFNFSVIEWINGFFEWLEGNELRFSEIFPGNKVRAQFARSLGLKVSSFKISDIVPILKAFIYGENYEIINSVIPGKSDEYLTNARHFILRLIPQISFAMGVVSLILREQLLSLGYEQDDFPYIVRNLATLIREGLDTEEKLQYKMSNRRLLRVEIHQIFKGYSNL